MTAPKKTAVAVIKVQQDDEGLRISYLYLYLPFTGDILKMTTSVHSIFAPPCIFLYGCSMLERDRIRVSLRKTARRPSFRLAVVSSFEVKHMLGHKYLSFKHVSIQDYRYLISLIEREEEAEMTSLSRERFERTLQDAVLSSLKGDTRRAFKKPPAEAAPEVPKRCGTWTSRIQVPAPCLRP